MGRCGEQRGPARVAGTHHVATHDQAVSRYLGLSLGGAKSDRTSITVVDYYRKQGKAFVVDIFEGIGSQEEQTGDEVLIELIKEISHEGAPVQTMAVDAPLTFPPCLLDCESGCHGYDKCKRPEVKWMRAQYQKAKAKNRKLKHFTPYSQRPVELYFRYAHPEVNLFQDETMGANLAPQTVRMNYLKRHFGDQFMLVEVWPKVALYYAQKGLKLTKKDVLEYRHIERGAGLRQHILERLIDCEKIFVYERDLKKLLTNVDAFDSMICAWMALQTDLERVVEFKHDLPLDSGWIQVPDL